MPGWTPKTPPEAIWPDYGTQKHFSCKSSTPDDQGKQPDTLQAAAEEALDAQTKASAALKLVIDQLRIKNDANEKIKVKLAERDEEVAILNRHMNKLREIIETQLKEIIQLGFDKIDLEVALKKEKKRHNSDEKQGATSWNDGADACDGQSQWRGDGWSEKEKLQSAVSVKEIQNMDWNGWGHKCEAKYNGTSEEDLITLRAINQGQADRITVLECRNRELEKDLRRTNW